VERTPPALRADTALLGGWARVTAAEAVMRAGPSAAAAEVQRLERHAPLRLLAGAGDWYRVRLPDGRTGYVSAGRSEAAVEPLRRHRVAAASTLRHAPSAAGVAMAELAAGTEVEVLAEFSGYALVRTPLAGIGWLSPARAELD
jgi:SH3-like domain-containing protein